MKPRRLSKHWHHLVILISFIAIVSAALVFVFLHFDLIPRAGSVERGYIDNFFKILLGIAAVIFTIVISVLGYSLIFFRRKSGDDTEGPPIKGFAPLERTWTIIPMILVIGLAVYGAVILDKMVAPGPPQTEMEIDVTAFRFGWQFTYPQYNVTSYELHVPVNQRILIKLQSKDVVHSFWVQEWGPKQDAVPGITTQVRYTPTVIGNYTVQCSQLCGYGHSYMTAPAAVTTAANFQSWILQQKSASTTTSPTSAVTTTTTSTTITTTVTTAVSSTTTPTSSSIANAVTMQLTVKNIAFDQSNITVPAGAEITINFDNTDAMPHNFALYTDSSAAVVVFRGQIVMGPATAVYKFTAPSTPGIYFFRCDVHPTLMTGTFVVK